MLARCWQVNYMLTCPHCSCCTWNWAQFYTELSSAIGIVPERKSKNSVLLLWTVQLCIFWKSQASFKRKWDNILILVSKGGRRTQRERKVCCCSPGQGSNMLQCVCARNEWNLPSFLHMSGVLGSTIADSFHLRCYLYHAFQPFGLWSLRFALPLYFTMFLHLFCSFQLLKLIYLLVMQSLSISL